MKPRILASFGLALVLPIFFAGCTKQESPPREVSAAVQPDPALAMQLVARESTDLFEPGEDDLDEDGVSEAPITAVSLEQNAPKNLQTADSVKEIIRLAESGVDETVLLAYVNKSAEAFYLGPDQIIYLSDIGVPSAVVLAMLEHDRAMKEVAGSVPEETPSVVAELSPPLPAPTEQEVTAGMPEEIPGGYSGLPNESEAAPVDYAGFYDALQPYGNWVEVEGYGRCWQPAVVIANHNWRPYCDRGHWVYTDCGWYWLSDYSWGWAPFHYGRWFQHVTLGWCWSPDLVWGPSWVTWRFTDAYCGWAPLPPRARYHAGRGLVVAGRLVPPNSDCGVKPGSYTFVAIRNLRDHHLRPSVLPRHDVTRIFERTIVSTRFSGNHHTIVNNGLAADRVAEATQNEVPRLAIGDLGARQPQAIRQQARDRTMAAYRRAEAQNAHMRNEQQTASVPPPPALVNAPPLRDGAAPILPRTPAAPLTHNLNGDMRAPPLSRSAIVGSVAPAPASRTGQPASRRTGRPAASTIQSTSIAEEKFPPGSLVLRGRRELTDAAQPDVLPMTAAPVVPPWMQTAPAEDVNRQQEAPPTAHVPRRGVLPRANSRSVGASRRLGPAQAAEAVARPEGLPAYQPQPAYQAPPPYQFPPTQAPPQYQSPSAYQIPPWNPPTQPAASRGEMLERRTRPEVQAAPRPAPHPESRSQSPRTESRPESRSDSSRSYNDSGRRR